ncbi:hypothetical protein CAPTEDRAFT_108701 [Capitella teleta]|uniref:NADH dehydrogenase [ubiquinone] 1 alpha subcomplex subunit 2 n=1 Tax=Capitella teleta TaxID=283909 RepID=R7TA50_CAPTE|nr:hypothetical protein CAPTEDRAFT_108701 [Capitella teleta]|eukprot:ELT87889.1 hypothetical protein CAPTEDRAFT_108701 [Capitella teleta]
MAAAKTLKFAAPLRELRIHLCQKSASSQGVREFIEQNYVTIKQNNPKFPILIRECSSVQPRVWARYDMGKEKNSSLQDFSSKEVLETVVALNQA